MALTLELEALFLEALNTSEIYPITSKVCFVKGLTNYIKYWHMFLTWFTYVLTIHDKTTTNKWTYERSHKSLNSYSLVEYNKIYPNTNSWKTLQEESLWQEDFVNLYFWNTLNKTHHSILMWNRNIRLHPLNTKHMYKERKETTHGKIGEITYIKILINQI